MLFYTKYSKLFSVNGVPKRAGPPDWVIGWPRSGPVRNFFLSFKITIFLVFKIVLSGRVGWGGLDPALSETLPYPHPRSGLVRDSPYPHPRSGSVRNSPLSKITVLWFLKLFY